MWNYLEDHNMIEKCKLEYKKKKRNKFVYSIFELCPAKLDGCQY